MNFEFIFLLHRYTYSNEFVSVEIFNNNLLLDYSGEYSVELYAFN